jgi:hypothetical protein
MQAGSILIGKSRHQSRSDREREKIQSQISTYALRFHTESDAVERRILEQRLEAVSTPPRIDSKLDSFIDRMLTLVDRHVFNSVFPEGEKMRIGWYNSRLGHHHEGGAGQNSDRLFFWFSEL